MGGCDVVLGDDAAHEWQSMLLYSLATRPNEGHIFQASQPGIFGTLCHPKILGHFVSEELGRLRSALRWEMPFSAG